MQLLIATVRVGKSLALRTLVNVPFFRLLLFFLLIVLAITRVEGTEVASKQQKKASIVALTLGASASIAFIVFLMHKRFVSSYSPENKDTSYSTHLEKLTRLITFSHIIMDMF
jgi:heme/copper-type cytochrome/quinol oxidase subunit 2